eukprot:6726765-Heterocapsa_arctica.AAC.1
MWPPAEATSSVHRAKLSLATESEEGTRTTSLKENRSTLGTTPASSALYDRVPVPARPSNREGLQAQADGSEAGNRGTIAASTSET